MKHLKRLSAILLSVSIISLLACPIAFSDNKEENTTVFSSDNTTDLSLFAYNSAPGYQYDPDTGENTVDENGYITNTYGYSLRSDPFNTKQVLEGKEYSSGNKHLHDPYWLRDENFFGKWNSNSNTWDIRGKLDYDNFPDLADVEMCVKNGDYESAKLAYYNYYIIKERNLGRKKILQLQRRTVSLPTYCLKTLCTMPTVV